MGVRRTGPALIVLMLSLTLVGCLAAAPAEWGTGQGMVSVEMSDDGTSVTIHERLSSDSNNDIVGVEVPVIGCNTNENGTIPQKSQDVTEADHGGDPIRIEGWLATSKNFPDDEGPSIQAIIVDVMPIEDAQDTKGIERDPGQQVPGIQDKRWATPLYAEAQFGQDYDAVEEKRGWALIGIIPGNENVLDGMAGLQEWNRPVALEGYMLHGSVGGTVTIPSGSSVQDCELSSNTRFAAHMVITSIEIGGVTASESEAYSMGSIPLIGGPLYLMIVLIGGGAGAFGTFTYASIQIRTAATKQAATLMSEKQIKAAGSVAKELKKHKKEVESINKDRETSESVGVVDDTSVKKVEIKEFDVSATLDGPADSMEALNSVSRTPGAGVIQTEASVEMDDKLREVMESAMEEASSPSSGPSGRRMGGGVTSGGGPGSRRTMSSSISSDEMVTENDSQPEPVKRSPPVKRKRAVRTPKQEITDPEPEPEEDQETRFDTREGPSISDDDEFSDFSF
tara:strand:+ start:607 stop:2133 length:1527 start_codon:yes stop_codon:yes gene_type:complete